MTFSREKSLIYFRAIFTTLLLGSYFLFRIEPIPFPYPHLIKYTVISIYFLTAIYLIISRLIEKKGRESLIKRFLYIQVILDSLITIFLIFVTGGVESWFTFIMLVNVVVSGIIINKRAGYIIATLLSILYGSLIDLQYYKVIPIAFDSSLRVNYFIYNIFIHILSLYLIAYLVGYLTTRLEKTSKGLEKATSDLRKQEFLNNIIIENVPSGILTIDEFNTIITFNTTAAKITGINKENAIGKNILEIFPFLGEVIYSIAWQEIPLRLEGVIQRNGQEVIIGITLSPFKKEAGSGIIGIFQDLTEIKKRELEEKRKEKLAAIGELSRNIAHEIRNPLASLKSSIEMLFEDRVSSEQKRRLMEIAIKEMDRLNKIITDFLFYTRPKPPEKDTFDLSEIMDEILLILKASPKAEGITIERNGISGIKLFGDQNQLKQVFINLGINALEAMDGGGTLRISISPENGYVKIIFKDTGKGIKEDELDKVFYPFYSTKSGGSGLGLSIAQKIIEEHGGKISVESRDDGTTFTVILPNKT